MSRYIKFVNAGETGKTVIVDVESITQQSLLGQIRWYSRWRQYAFYPCQGTIFNPECMKDISDKIHQLMNDRK